MGSIWSPKWTTLDPRWAPLGPKRRVGERQTDIFFSVELMDASWGSLQTFLKHSRQFPKRRFYVGVSVVLAR